MYADRDEKETGRGMGAHAVGTGAHHHMEVWYRG